MKAYYAVEASITLKIDYVIFHFEVVNGVKD